MLNFNQDCRVVSGINPATVNSTTSGDWVNMENFQYLTIVAHMGAVTAGKKIAIRQAKTNAGGSKVTMSTPFVGGVYYENTASASKAAFTATTAASSAKYVSVGNSDSSCVFIATVDATDMSASFDYLNAQAVSSAWNAVFGVTYILHGTRYQQSSIPDPTL